VAIEFQLKGTFDLAEPLRDALCAALGPVACEKPSELEHIEFQLWCPLVLVTAFASPLAAAKPERKRRVESTVFFRVLDKDRVVEATNLVVACVSAALGVARGDLRLLFCGDRLLLARVDDDVRLFLHGGDPRTEFWNTSERTRALECRHRFVRLEPR
jgi:hypothetical protein